MNQNNLMLIFSIFGGTGGVGTLLHYMFPTLFPTIGATLIGLNPYIWLVAILVLIVVGQQIFIFVKLKGA